MLRLIFFGPPGSGKGTYASRICPKFEIPHISTGDIFREAVKSKTELGKKVKVYLDRGELVPDDIANEVVKVRLKQPDCKKGFILDGYPRTINQVKFLEKITKIDAIINLTVPDKVIIARLSSRIVCKKCGAIYNLLYLKPKKEGICDKCGEELYQREDDTPEVIQERLNVYRKQTEPLIKYYKSKGLLHNVRCNKVDIPPDVMVKKIIDVLKNLNLI